MEQKLHTRRKPDFGGGGGGGGGGELGAFSRSYREVIIRRFARPRVLLRHVWPDMQGGANIVLCASPASQIHLQGVTSISVSAYEARVQGKCLLAYR